MATTPDLQRAANLLAEVLALLQSMDITQEQPMPVEPDSIICTVNNAPDSECNEMGKSKVFLP